MKSLFNQNNRFRLNMDTTDLNHLVNEINQKTEIEEEVDDNFSDDELPKNENKDLSNINQENYIKNDLDNAKLALNKNEEIIDEDKTNDFNNKINDNVVKLN